MSQDFTVVLAAPAAPLADTLERLRDELGRMRFRSNLVLVRAAFDSRPDRLVFDEDDRGEEIHIDDNVEQVRHLTDGWEGGSIEFYDDDMMLYLLLGSRDGTLCCFIDLPERTLRRLFQNQHSDRFFAAVSAIAAACSAVGGYGELELAFAPLASNAVLSAIHHNPQRTQPGPAWLGLIPIARLTKEEVQRQFGATHEIVASTHGYWLLREYSFLELFQAT